MNRPGFDSAGMTATEFSRVPASGGWHATHFYYQWNRGPLAEMAAPQVAAGRKGVIAALDPASSDAPLRLQSFIVSGGKADFGLLAMDPDPLKVDRVHQKLMSSPLGVALTPTYSFVSVTEISEYVPSVHEYAERIAAEGDAAGSPTHQAKVKAYADRLDAMNRQRLTPTFPLYPNMCFYPMNKKRVPVENWFLLPKTERNRLMSEHAKSGMAFANKVSQLITVALGFDDWEWGVTLWAANPEYLKEIVYRMRFDEASARYAEFGPFYAGYVASAEEILDHCLIGAASA